jgi:hypothetical protein
MVSKYHGQTNSFPWVWRQARGKAVQNRKRGAIRIAFLILYPSSFFPNR